jgi:hypothetical protein
MAFWITSSLSTIWQRKHHSKHEAHTKVQIHSLLYDIPRVEEDVDDRLTYQWTTTKDSSKTSHWANHNGHVRGNINYKHWDSVRKISSSSGPFLFFNFMVKIGICWNW